MPLFDKFKDVLSSYRCSVCGTVFHKEEELRNHNKIHEIEKANAKPIPQPIKEETYKPQIIGGRCPSCGFPYKNRYQKEAHEKEHELLSKDPSLILNHACCYTGGYPDLVGGVFGNLRVYSNPYKVALKLEKTEFVLPFDRIKRVKLVTKKEISVGRFIMFGLWSLALKKDVQYFLIGYEDELGDIQEGVF
jgi:uncharacterized C2H2 Zn-finger protein